MSLHETEYEKVSMKRVIKTFSLNTKFNNKISGTMGQTDDLMLGMAQIPV